MKHFFLNVISTQIITNVLSRKNVGRLKHFFVVVVFAFDHTINMKYNYYNFPILTTTHNFFITVEIIYDYYH